MAYSLVIYCSMCESCVVSMTSFFNNGYVSWKSGLESCVVRKFDDRTIELRECDRFIWGSVENNCWYVVDSLEPAAINLGALVGCEHGLTMLCLLWNGGGARTDMEMFIRAMD